MQTRVTALLQKAQSEGRDVSDKELADLRAETDAARAEWDSLN